MPRHRPEAGDWLASFQHDGDDCHLGGLPLSRTGCGLGGRDGCLDIISSAADLFTVAADLLQDAGEALHGFTILSSGAGVRMCPPCNPYSPRRLDNSAPGEIIFPVVWKSLRSGYVRVRSSLGRSSILGAFTGLQLGCVDMCVDMGDD